jgi:hypothetical protein
MQVAQEQRSEPRFEVQEGSVVMDGGGYPLENWSDKGFSLISYTGQRRPGDEVEIAYLVYLGQTMIQLRGRAIIMWKDPERHRIGAHVIEIDEESRQRLRETLRVL